MSVSTGCGVSYSDEGRVCTSFIKNHWDHMMKRILEDLPAFHRLPFKHLRKTGSTYIGHMHIKNAAELASMYLSHGEKADSHDQLLPAYTSRPWKKLHKALLLLRKKLLPVFTSVKNTWESSVVRISPLTVAKIKALRGQGKTLKDIAKEVGVHCVTVGKICRVEGRFEDDPIRPREEAAVRSDLQVPSPLPQGGAAQELVPAKDDDIDILAGPCQPTEEEVDGPAPAKAPGAREGGEQAETLRKV
jgi:hypothetical protein